MYQQNNQRQSDVAVKVEMLLDKLELIYAAHPAPHLRAFPLAQIYASTTHRYNNANRLYGANLNISAENDFQYHSGQFIRESEHCCRLLTQQFYRPPYTDVQFLSQVKHSLENLACLQYNCERSFRPHYCSRRNLSWHIEQLSHTERQLIGLLQYHIDHGGKPWLVALLQQHIEFLGQCIDQLNSLAEDLWAYQRPYRQGNSHRFAFGGYGSPYNSTGYRANSYAQQAPNHTVQSDLNELPETGNQPVYETAANAAQQPAAAPGQEGNTGSVATTEPTVAPEKSTGEVAFAIHDTPVAADHTSGTAMLHAADTAAADDRPATVPGTATRATSSVTQKAKNKTKSKNQTPRGKRKPITEQDISDEFPELEVEYYLDGKKCSKEHAREFGTGSHVKTTTIGNIHKIFLTSEQGEQASEKEELHSPKVLH